MARLPVCLGWMWEDGLSLPAFQVLAWGCWAGSLVAID